MALCPFADHLLIRPGSSDPAIDVVGAILHVDAMNADSLHDYFDGPSNGIESHFFVTKRLDPRRPGRTVIEQYRNTGYEADANLKANSFFEDGRRKGFVSIETQGFGSGEWSPEQLASIKELLVWLGGEHDFPLRRCPGPFTPGVGFHIMWGSPGPWTPVAKSCPGPDRVRQFDNDLVPWMRQGAPIQEDDVTAADVWDAKLNEYDTGTKNEQVPARVLLAQAHNRAGDARTAANQALKATSRIEAALGALAKAIGPEVEKAVKEALAEAVVDVDVTVTTPGEPATE